MSILPTPADRLARARVDLRMGLPVVLRHGTTSILAAAAETILPAHFAEMRLIGPVDLAITARRAETLKARSYDGDLARVHVPDAADLAWVQAVANPADDLRVPMKGPLSTARGGAADLHRLGIRVAKTARLLPAMITVAIPDTAADLTAHLTVLDAQTLEPLLDMQRAMSPVVAARLPIYASEAGRVHVFRPDDGGEEHYAIEIGRPDRNMPVLARLHSACFTGDVLGSLKCDCGPQLQAALTMMGREGAGVLLYLNQEGRGIGLANKMRAYALQDQGFDTVEANHRLGFEDDERDFRLGADLLKSLGFSSVRLLTNNPGKIAMMEKTGIKVAERVPLKVGETAFNRAYLATKAAKSGHLL